MESKKQKINKNNKLLIKRGILILLTVLFIGVLYLVLIRPLFKKNTPLVKIKNGVVEELELDLGSRIPSIDKFIKKKGIKGDIKVYYDDWLVESDVLTEVGVYHVVITTSDKEYYSTITVKDTTPPILKVRDLTIGVNQHYDPSSFVESCVDNSNRNCTFYFSDEAMQNYSSAGEYKVRVIARDDAFNEVEKSVKLIISDQVSENIAPDRKINSGVDTKIEDNVKKTSKYGVDIVTKESVYYEVDSDGNEKRIRSKVTSEIDRDHYNASKEELLTDARKQIQVNKTLIDSVVDTVNKYRKNEGLAPLKLSKELNELASSRSLEIAWSGNFSHNRPNGKNSYSISKDLGYNITILGENIARSKDYSTIDSVLSYWKTSLGSNKNLLNLKYQNLGVGMVNIGDEYYWVLLFN